MIVRFLQCRQRAVAVVLTVIMVSSAGSCSRGGGEPALPTGAPTTAQAVRGDECFDAKGDILTNASDEGSTISEPAGVDISWAAATVDGDLLRVSFRTVGYIDAAPNPEFVVANGSLESASDQYWELRSERAGSRWSLKLVMFPKGQSRQQEKTINVPVSVEGNELRYSVPLGQLPPISTVLWQFGAGAGVSDESRVVDDCQPFQQTGSPGDTVPPIGGSTPTLPSVPTVTGSVGQTLNAPDGSKVTVKLIEVPAVPNNEQTPEPIPGARFAAAEVEVCAGNFQLDNIGERRWSMEVTGDRRVSAWDAPRSPKSPRFSAGATVRPGECIGGWVVFQIADNADPVSVDYDTSGTGVGPVVTFRA
ncbi:MAG: hypothetical protein N2037_05375 [Acidimicrobiales bacterium]|nr:hypothetical protein [Acidimicrobiales bacterium]